MLCLRARVVGVNVIEYDGVRRWYVYKVSVFDDIELFFCGEFIWIECFVNLVV